MLKRALLCPRRHNVGETVVPVINQDTQGEEKKNKARRAGRPGLKMGKELEWLHCCRAGKV